MIDRIRTRFTVLLLIAAMICGPVIPAAADTCMPAFREMNAEVTALRGAALYAFNLNSDFTPDGAARLAVVPFGTQLTLIGEFEENGVHYFITEYRGQTGAVSIRDLRVDLTPVAPETETAYPAPLHRVVINPDGIEMYAGPSTAYQLLRTLPFGTEVEITHSDTVELDNDSSNWKYVTAGGWIYDNVFGALGWSTQFTEEAPMPAGKATLLQEMPMLSWQRMLYEVHGIVPENENEPPITAVPAGMALTFRWYYGEYGYAVYNGKSGWVRLMDPVSAAYDVNAWLLTVQPQLLYKAPRADAETGTVISPFEIVPVTQCGAEAENSGAWLRVEVNGSPFWVCTEDGEAPALFRGGAICIAAEDCTVYETPDPAAVQRGTIRRGEQIRDCFSYDKETTEDSFECWTFVAGGSLSGWVQDLTIETRAYDPPFYALDLHALGRDRVQTMPAPAVAAAAFDAAPLVIKGEEATEIIEASEPDRAQLLDVLLPQRKQRSPRAIILICVGAAAGLAAAAGAGIARVRKKKTEKTDGKPTKKGEPEE